MPLYNFTSLPDHFSTSKQPQLHIEVAQRPTPDLSYLHELKPTRIFLDAKHEKEEVIVPALEQLSELKSLRSLELKWMDRSFPKILTRMHNLQHLGIDNYSLVSLPNDLGRLDRLRSLYLDTTHLLGLPGNIHLMKNLRELFLNTHYMERLPNNFAKLNNLETFGLKIKDNYAYIDWGKYGYFLSKWDQSGEEIFDMLSQLPNLRRLSLIEDDDLNHHTFPNLQHRKAVFDLIPESLENLQGLEELELRRNKGLALPQSLTRLPNLRKIWVDNPLRDQLTNYFPHGNWVGSEYFGHFEIPENGHSRLE